MSIISAPDYIVARSGKQDLNRLAWINYAAPNQYGERTSFDDEMVEEEASTLGLYLLNAQDGILKASRFDAAGQETIDGFLAYMQCTRGIVTIDYFFALKSDGKPGSALMRNFLESMDKNDECRMIKVKSSDFATPVYGRYGFGPDYNGYRTLSKSLTEGAKEYHFPLVRKLAA